MEVQCYQSKIINTLMGPFPTIHDFMRIDLNEKDHTFIEHRYWIFDGSGQSYTRKLGTYELTDEKLILTYTKCLTLSTEKGEEIGMEYDEKLQEIESIYESDETFDQYIKIYLAIKDEDMVESEIRKSGETYRCKREYGSLDIKTNEKPFGRGGIYKKITLCST